MADKFDGDIPDFGDEDALREAFQRFLQGDETFDPAELMKAAGIDVNGPELKAMMQQLGSAFGSDGLLKTTASRDHAVSVASEGSTSPDSATSQALSSAANVATLWLGEVTSIAELAETICAVADTDSEVTYTDPRPGDIDESVADISKARSELGFEPTVSLREGLKTIL